MKRDIPLSHPGAVLKEEFLEPMHLSVYALAKAINVSRGRMNKICQGKHGITASLAVRLGRFFGVDPQWFMNMQTKYDLAVASDNLAETLERIEPHQREIA